MTRYSRRVFINVPVADLQRSMEFFTKLGFRFHPMFTDEDAACMIVSDYAYVMLLTEPFFRKFTNRQICDTERQTEGIFAVSCCNRDEVDEMVRRAVAAGGRHAMEPVDRGFLYGWSFYDPDGHQWEVVWMNPSAAEQRH